MTYLKDFIIANTLLYTSLLIGNTFWHNFIATMLPLDLIGWGSLVAVVLYYFQSMSHNIIQSTKS